MADQENTLANLARSGRMRIAAALLVTALVGGSLGVIILRGDNAGNALLYSGLDLEEAAEIAGRLETANIRYSLEGGGSAIFVNRARVDQARMMLSEQGLPTRGSVGWEIFDKTDSFGQTTFVQNINKIRALEGELSRTIASLDLVTAARVHLVLPERPLFQREGEKPKATVVLGLTGSSMNGEKVRAIRNLVASAVPGLAVSAITVVDDQGRMLAAGSDATESGGLAGAMGDERKVALEEQQRQKVLEIVENIAGIGAARVQVSLDVDFNRVTESQETFDPDGRVIRSSSTIENSSNSRDNQQRDGVTAANNIPNGEEVPAEPQPTSQNTQSSTEETVNYEISRSTRTEVIEGGRIQRMTVAVAVDDKRVPGVDGEPATFEPRSPEEIDRILTLVKSAVGFDEARGDVITVENIAFARPEASLEDATPPGPFDFDKFDIVRGVEIGALLITALMLVLFVLRPLVKGLMARPEEGDQLGLEGPAPSQRKISSGGGSAPPPAAGVPDPDLLGVAEPPSPTDAGIDVARISGRVKASSIKKMSEVVSQHPDESLAIIRTWLAEPNKETA